LHGRRGAPPSYNPGKPAKDVAPPMGTARIPPDGPVLCVDLDGTLLRTDLLYEAVLALLRANPFYVLLLPWWLLRGKAALKAEISRRVELDPADLPYDERVLDLLRAHDGTRVLCTASDDRLAQAVATHLGLFDTVLASDGRCNLSGARKAQALTERYGAGGFDYAGNGRVDLHVWRHARSAWVVNGSAGLARAAGGLTRVAGHLPSQGGGLRTWLRAMRLHQWLKNLLVLLPLLASHRFLEPPAILAALTVFAAFSLCASGVYILNDLFDLAADRQHPRKKQRPFAAGELPLLHGFVATAVLTLAGFALAFGVNLRTGLVLAAYCACTLAYSLYLKRKAMVDVLLLAGLYTLRIIAGTVAIGAALSFWLLAFSMFIFLSLAMLKRYTELSALGASGRNAANGRGYQVDDLALLQSLGGASGYLAVLVFALYINSPESLVLYSHPKALWLICPLLLYWISRAWMVARRGEMHDDPVVFAATDRVSQGVAVLCGLLAFGAI
jgi:4-hydroxybenzoate polyprenyltransferase